MGRAMAHLMEGEFASRVRLHVTLHSQSPEEDWLDALASEAWVDFSLPAGIHGIHSAIASALRAQPSARLPALVIGTTGHDSRERSLIEDLATKTLVLQAPNFSIGILMLRKVLEFASPMLTESGFKPVMLETHHLHKKDAPSGTALSLAASTRGMTAERIHSVRAGEVIGDHSVTFHGSGEQVGFSHHAMNREIFARGALEAALWLADRRAVAPSAAGNVTLDDFFEEKYACLTPSK
jgi:4-hydroxy-tetrahydrodipicolinate reductase